MRGARSGQHADPDRCLTQPPDGLPEREGDITGGGRDKHDPFARRRDGDGCGSIGHGRPADEDEVVDASEALDQRREALLVDAVPLRLACEDAGELGGAGGAFAGPDANRAEDVTRSRVTPQVVDEARRRGKIEQRGERR